MAYSKISILKLFFFSFCLISYLHSNAQLVLHPAAMSGNLFTYNHESLKRLPEGYYVIATERNCSECFTKACQNLLNVAENSKQIYLLIFTSGDVFGTLASYKSFKKITPCANTVFFYFLTSEDSTFMKYAKQPSPLIARCTKDSLILLDYYTSKRIWDK